MVVKQLFILYSDCAVGDKSLDAHIRAIRKSGGVNVLVANRVDLAGFLITWEVEDGR